MPRPDKYKPFVLIADAVAITHLILGTLIVLVGELTEAFSFLGYKHTGVDFVYLYLDAPVFAIIKGILPTVSGDSFYVLATCALVLCLGSVFYGVLTYWALRLFSHLFKSKQ